MADAPGTVKSKTHRVLVVEDEDNIAMALQYVIEREGHRYFRIADGAEAEAAIREIRPDLILLDVMLPQVSGYDICQAVRSDGELAAVRILIMTARGSLAQRDRALAVGADGFLAKPFSLDDLREKMRAQLG
ncbi:response regulator transcription factor [Paragemmobacter ruber]|uniref:Response regulator n=1 Tax=Paragemmobacter ruber TaxID=1985673 RepID=A0ABW9Y593_9RHOB|nr:response regulator [Rhodobacter ruber]